MANKVYIVVNEEQEQEVLDKVYKKGKMWPSQDGRGNYWSPVHKYVEFPYVIVDCGKRLIWTNIDRLTDEEIIFDGRKEEQMSDKYVVSQEFMTELKEWKQANFSDDFMFVNGDTIYDFSEVVNNWWYAPLSDQEQNNRLIAIIRWVNGEDVFEVEKPKKFIVRSKESDIDNDYTYVYVTNSGLQEASYNKSIATKFNTKEEAQEWANSHQEVVEV